MVIKTFRGVYGKSQKDRLAWYEIVGWLFLGVVAMIYGIWQIHETFELRNDGVTTIAEITDLNSGVFGTTTVLFTANGEVRHIVGEFSPRSEWEIGDEIRIIYLPRNPRIVRPARGVDNVRLFEIAAIVSGTLILIDFAYTMKTQPSRRWKNGTFT